MFVEFESQNRFVFVQLQEHNFTGRGVKCRLSAGVTLNQLMEDFQTNNRGQMKDLDEFVLMVLFVVLLIFGGAGK